ncbi:MAG: decarboxylating 6-phosphogluconate dehydrogenase [Candidatus Eisenbacteria bacterium]|jgi:6-phosphogluconate dehydrogenase|nr:decarboxylating 6-phosphogluconate dehydrogenase [Candidatus Eisenbacteria bacterium]
MELGFLGLGRMGFNMTLRLLRGGHRVVAWNRSPDKVQEAVAQGAVGAASVAEVVGALAAPRVLWIMLPAGKATDDMIDQLVPLLSKGDLIVDGGNTNFHDDKRRAAALATHGIGYADVGTSGGVWGLQNGYCMMAGGAPNDIARLTPALDTLGPPDGWLHTGAVGSGHFSKMIHNGIEYGMMQAYAEGFEILQASEYDYDLAKLSHLWNQGSVVRSWLLELAELAFKQDPKLEKIRGFVEDSGEGRWTVLEAIDKNIPAEVLTLSLMRRFRSRQEDTFTDRVLAALRNQFGGHAVKEK